MKKIIIRISGGMVQDVYADTDEKIEVEILDHDIGRDGGCFSCEGEEQEYEDKCERLEAEIASMKAIY